MSQMVMSNAPACGRVCPVTVMAGVSASILLLSSGPKAYLSGAFTSLAFAQAHTRSAAFSKRRAFDRSLLETLCPPFACGFGPEPDMSQPRVASRFWRTLRPGTSHDYSSQPRSRERSLLPAVGAWSRPAGGQALEGSLGDKISEGGTADIHAWAPGSGRKTVQEGFSPQLGQQGARMTQAVFAAGVPAPEVFGEVTLTDASASCSAASMDRHCCR